MISENILKEYDYVFKNYFLVDGNEDLAKEAIQQTIFRIMIMIQNGVKMNIDKPRSYIIYSSKTNFRQARSNHGSYKWLYYESSRAPSDLDSSDEGIHFQSIVDTENLGQINSVEHKLELDDVKKFLGKDLDFVLDHLDFSDGSRLRGAKGKSHRPRIFESDSDRYKMSYIRKKARKHFC